MASPTDPGRPLVARVFELVTAAEALAALGAHLRIDAEGLEVAPALAAGLDEVAARLGIAAGATAEQRTAALGAIRALLRQAHDLVEQPARPPGWAYDDPVMLEAAGRASIQVAHAIAAAAPRLEGLAERLAGQGAAFLDVGTGAARLAIALAGIYPALAVTGIDIWPPSLRLAEENARPLAGRVRIVEQDVTTLAEREAYDAAWLPGPFLPREVCLRALAAVRGALRPGGWVILGLFGGSPDPLALALADLRAIRSGGHPWRVDEACAALAAAGYESVGQVEHGVAAHARLIAGRAPP